MGKLLNRRGMLRAGLGVAALPALRGLGFAAPAAEGGLLILVNLRGGMDGLHVLSPADDAQFADKRPPQLRTLAEGSGAGHRLEASATTDFRLHASAGGLAEFWQAGRLAIWPAAGLPATTRSHFEAQAMMGLGQGLRGASAAGAPGWLAEWTAMVAGPGAGISAIAAQSSLPPELQRSRHALAVASTNGGLGMPGEAFGDRMLEALYAGPGPVAAAGREAIAGLGALDRLLPRDAAGKVVAYQPRPGVQYGPAREFGQALAVVAQLARLQPRLVAASVDLAGWDMHDGQPYRMADRMRVLSAGLVALSEDLEGLGRRWTVLLASEFGRRLRSNRSMGTDHGRAGLVMALGDAQFGLKRHFGAWPGLAPEALEEGVDLRVATDYREAFRAVIGDLRPGAPLPFAGV